jgi:hypothetical protein
LSAVVLVQSLFRLKCKAEEVHKLIILPARTENIRIGTVDKKISDG